MAYGRCEGAAFAGADDREVEVQQSNAGCTEHHR